MDAREQLRRFLEQRREAGETELVFDSLTVDEAMRLLGAGPRQPEANGARRPLSGEDRTQPATNEAAASGSTSAPSTGKDWRAVLREAGATPARDDARPAVTEKVARFAMPKPPAADNTSSLQVSVDNLPPGIVIGGAGKELFGGSASRFATLDELSTAVSTCTLCPLYRDAKHPVPGEGNPDADLMCVGEAPGAREDELGRPFVGDAGQLLDKILAAIKLSRAEVYICNVLKHRPPGNRNPMPDEVQACSPYLLRQIELIKPRVIVAFGNFAAQTLLNTRDGVSKLRGRIHRYHGVPLVVTYHPAALLRNPSWKRPAWDDVQLARKLLDRVISS